jgi:hypothetical protein
VGYCWIYGNAVKTTVFKLLGSKVCFIVTWDGIHQYFYNFSIFFLSFF